MSTPISFCDISARYGQAPAPQKTIEEQTGWNLSDLFLNYMLKLRRQNQQSAKQAEEDALMAMIDAMNASEEDKASGKAERTLANALANAGKAVHERYDGAVAPEDTLTVQVMLACLGDRFTFEQADAIRENTQKTQQLEERDRREERRDVTEARDPSETGDPHQIGKEV